MNTSPEERFEQALQRYLVAVAEYRQACALLPEELGIPRAAQLMEEGADRLCAQIMRQGDTRADMEREEIKQRAARARTIIDSELAAPWKDEDEESPPLHLTKRLNAIAQERSS